MAEDPTVATPVEPGTASPGDQASPEQEKLAALQGEVEKYKDLLLRKAAEFENYKRRMENDTAAIVKFANEDLIASILPIADDFERSLKHAKDSTDFEALLRGIEMIYQKMVKALDALGVKPLETVGKEFSVELHDALMQIPRADVPPHTILEEVEKGYTLRGKVIRHAKVVVASAPAEPTLDQGEQRTAEEPN